MYRKIVSFLYAHPQCPFTLYFSGPYIEWFEKNHREFLDILKELTDRKQLELLTGGYYDPIFPLLLPVDRVGQIELLTTSVRKAIGKRPRGAWLTGSIWDSSLISSFSTCGIEYVLLDSRYTNALYRPLIVEDMGKTITVLPCIAGSAEDLQMSPDEYFEKTIKPTKNIDNAFVCCFFDAEEIINQNADAWFLRLHELICNHTEVESTNPSRYLKTATTFKKTYFASGASPAVLQRFTGTAFAHKNSVRNYLLEFPEALSLYSKMMYVSLLVNQCRGDRSRKKAAREELWRAQNCNAYWFLGSDGVTNQNIRQQSYHHLLNAEKIVRSAGSFVPSVVSFDFDMDGFQEYLFQFDAYNFVLSTRGGLIQELDSMTALRNYADTMCRDTEYDGIRDLYPRKLFVDHLISFDDFNKLKSGISDTDTVFPKLRYQEVFFDRAKREVQLKAFGRFKNQAVSLKKKYIASNSGIQVQYILKNESTATLRCCLAVESNFAFQGADSDQQKIEAIIDTSLHEIIPTEPVCFLCGAAYVELADLCAPISFSYETNEESGFFSYPLTITRPIQGVKTEKYQATSCTFFWHLEVFPDREVEKTIQLSIKAKRKPRRTISAV